MKRNANALESTRRIRTEHFVSDHLKWIGVVILLFSFMALPVHADESSPPSFTKIYRQEGEGASAPEEMFYFDAQLVLHNGNPVQETDPLWDDCGHIQIGDLHHGEGVHFEGTGQNNALIFVPDNTTSYIEPGTFVYALKERPGDTAGMVYDPDAYELSFMVDDDYSYVSDAEGIPLIILRKGNEKIQSITNTYQAGKIRIEKKAEGFDRDAGFRVNLSLDAGEKQVRSLIQIKGVNVPETIAEEIHPSDWNNGKYTLSFEVKDGTSVELSNVPAGVECVVEEEENERYETVYQLNVNGEVSKENRHVVSSGEDCSFLIHNIGRGEQLKTAAMSGRIPAAGVLAMSLFAAILFVLKLKWLR